MSKDQVAEKAQKMEGLAITNPAQFAHELHDMSAKERSKIVAKIKEDQSKDTSGALPHVEFFDSGNVKSVDSKSVNDKSHTISHHTEFDRKSGKMTDDRTEDSVRGYTSAKEDKFDAQGHKLSHREENYNGSVVQDNYDPKNGARESTDYFFKNGSYKLHQDFNTRTGQIIRSTEHNQGSTPDTTTDKTTSYENGKKYIEDTVNGLGDVHHVVYNPNGTTQWVEDSKGNR
jgi:hypothetical protein